MSVKFLVDSAADLTLEEAKTLGVTHLPLKVLFGEEEYLDAVTLGYLDFYEKLAACDKLPTTSQASPAEFEKVFGELTANGDEVVAITVSSQLSGTYQSACIGADEFEGKVYVVDSMNVTLGERLVLMRGLQLAQQGLSAREIADKLNEEKGSIRLFAVLDTLENLKKSGRISAATALAGTMLSIKPAVAVEDGKIVMAGKARGAHQGNKLLRDLIEKTGGIDFDKPHTLAYSGPSDERLQKFIAESANIWEGHSRPPIATVGAVIGTHVGPGAWAMAYFEK